jgi:hypothetical protein
MRTKGSFNEAGKGERRKTKDATRIAPIATKRKTVAADVRGSLLFEI